ncbi:unnamed protein product [Mytilus edulis]|uniref:Uncharacterized protein n=1 Tax=Mytilus edulis TaxID=6550 RepID=A0A8S3SKG2_MYTED|nr:unnamed protein product [Mytilus edulis]
MNQFKDKNVSLQFYNYLCNIVGSEEVVRTRREILNAKDIVENTTSVTFISSGSKAEGLDIKKSDFDLMILIKCIRVHVGLNDIQLYRNKTPLVMVTNDTKPGFAKLKFVDKSDVDNAITHDCCEILGEETYISSKRVGESNLPVGLIIHGPYQSTPDGKYDLLFLSHCILKSCKRGAQDTGRAFKKMDTIQ